MYLPKGISLKDESDTFKLSSMERNIVDSLRMTPSAHFALARRDEFVVAVYEDVHIASVIISQNVHEAILGIFCEIVSNNVRKENDNV